jgi:type IX secretion system PorP/SprF family membrane protein
MRLKVKVLFLFFAHSAIIFHLLGQDVHYSQFYNAPLFLNPAQTGSYEGSWRVMDSYRQQWTAISPPYISNALGYDQQIIDKTDKLSAGCMMVYDRSGDLKFTAAKLYLSIAYHKKIGENYLISGGLQPLFSSKTFSTQNLTFPDQFNNSTGNFDGSLPTSDAFSNRQASNINLNTGVYLKKTQGKSRPEIGIGVFNIIPSRESFYDFSIQAQRRIGSNLAWGLDIGSQYFIKPHMQYLYQEKASSMMLGSNIGYYIKPNSAGLKFLYIGGFSRTGFSRTTDSFVAVLGGRIKKWDVGISYDINTSSLKTATNARGGFEFSVIYTNWKELLNQLTPNCDRM